MNTLTFTLKQHTPLIHFQHEQEGATLRATELKPKLDQFIINKLLQENTIPFSDDNDAQKRFKIIATFPANHGKNSFGLHKPEWKDWLIGQGRNDHVALDYKVRVRISLDPLFIPSDIENGYPLFFGNIKKSGVDRKHFVLYEKAVVEISSFSTKLIEEIGKAFCVFLMRTNFGTRQSKGFGSFYVDPSSLAFRSNRSTYEEPKLKYSFRVDVRSEDTLKRKYVKLFTTIDIFYKALRSGINLKSKAIFEKTRIDGNTEILIERQTRFYFKSLLFYYLKKKGLQWDKKTIKEEYFRESYYRRRASRKEKEQINKEFVFERGPSEQKILHPDSDTLNFSEGRITGEKFLFRDLFGLSTDEQWLSYGKNISKQHAQKVNGRFEQVNENDRNRIARFKSPILFKPIIKDDHTEFTVFFEAEKLNKNYLGKYFNIQKNGAGNLVLQIPEEFDFDEFFGFIFDKNNVDIKTYVDKKYQEDPSGYFNTLEDIFNQLQKKDE